MAILITKREQARKLAFVLASKILRDQVLTLPVSDFIHPSSSTLVFSELNKIADGLEKRSKNLKTEGFEVI